MKIYLSARYARMDELKRYREQLVAAGHECTSTWLDGGTFENNAANAYLDVVDVQRADMLINFTEEPVEHSPHAFASRGGRHVEFGVALADPDKFCVVVGARENVFHYHADVAVFATWAECLKMLEEQS